MRAPSPANLLGRALAAGDPLAFESLYDRLARPLWRVAMSMLHDRHAAEDAVQETFVNLVRWRVALTRVEDLDAYVFACLRSAGGRRISQFHAERRRLEAATFAIGGQCEPDASSMDESPLRRLLAGLPAAQRNVVTLKIDGGLTFAQIAQVLNVRPNTAASRYRYALEKLRRAMEDRNDE
jgi:RNA polymerase sigma-70 factor (ECF subfamily)